MMVKGSTFSYICTASSICRYEYEYKLHRLQNKQMEIREMEDNMNGSIPDPAHFFRSHSAYQQLLCAHRTCSSLSESMPTYVELQSGCGWSLQAYAH